MKRLTTSLATTAIAAAIVTVSAGAQTIRGSIEISRTMTRRSVTAAVPLYQRGVTAKLGKEAESDPIAFERSHVILYLEPVAATSSAPVHAAPFVMQQQDRQFLPDLLVVPLGAMVSFPNMDPIFHNVFSLSHVKSFDLGSYDKGDSRNVTFTRPGIISVYCHLHPNMAATILVAPSRWYARSDRDGRFLIHDVPPGQYTVVAWHKAAGIFRQTITIEAGKDAPVHFVLPYAETIQQPSPNARAALSDGAIK